MTGREWQPGDVMVATWATIYGEPVVHFMVDGCKNIDHRDEPHWHDVRGGWTSSLAAAADVRPLAVIDPEDREQVERLAKAINDAIENQSLITSTEMTQAALRKFASPTPTKPDEPTGLGAVVEDASGAEYVRIGRKPGSVWYQPHGRYFRWDGIDVAKITCNGADVETGEPS